VIEAGYLLDTNACIALMAGRPPAVRARLLAARASGLAASVPAIALYELRYGVAKSRRRGANSEALDLLLAQGLEVLPFDREDAASAGEVRAALETAGTPIGPYDLLIAGQALRRGLTLVTANVREFARVPALSWEDWAASPQAPGDRSR
jgi:tRNA(fMet)-specific endonuclease VapC